MTTLERPPKCPECVADAIPGEDYTCPECEFCKSCGAGIGAFRRMGEGTCPKCDPISSADSEDKKACFCIACQGGVSGPCRVNL